MESNKKILEEAQSVDEREHRMTIEIAKVNKKIKNMSLWAWSLVFLGGAILIAGVVIYFCWTDLFQNLSLLGDFFGGTVASVWSLAGILLIYIAFLGQKQQLLQQALQIMQSKVELRYTLLEIKGQREEMIEQNCTLKQQKFDNTFFQLLNAFANIIASMDLRNVREKSIIAEGRDCFEQFYKNLKECIAAQAPNSRMRNMHGKTLIETKTADVEKTLTGYEIFFKDHQNDLGHYFRTLYHIIKFIKNSEVEDKKTYTNFVRAQLSSHELALIFYNCLSEHGSRKFKPLLEEFAMLKNLNKGLIFNNAHLREYEERAYSSVLL